MDAPIELVDWVLFAMACPVRAVGIGPPLA